MQLSELLETIRRPYVAQFELMLRSMHGSEILVEPAMRDRSGAPLQQGVLHLPVRADVVLKGESGGSPMQIEPPSRVQFEPIELPNWNGLVAGVEPFEWFACGVYLSHPAENPDWSAPRAWFLDAFGGDDPWVAPRDARPTGRVHSLGDPQRGGEGFWRLRLDLGTAPVNALVNFIGSLADAGFTQVQLSS
jgi:hypothetical protein